MTAHLEETQSDGRELFVVLRQFGVDDYAFGLTLSPDGKKIAYTRGPNRSLPPRQLFAAAVDALDEVRQLTKLPVSANVPRWSLDGSRIAFWTEGDL